MIKCSILSVFIAIFSSQAFPCADDSGHFVCASCDWPKKASCGSITTKQVVSLFLENHKKGIPEDDMGPFQAFSCPNGRTELGVFWSDKDCEEIGGLSGLSEQMFPELTHKSECKLGEPGISKRSGIDRVTRIAPKH